MFVDRELFNMFHRLVLLRLGTFEFVLIVTEVNCNSVYVDESKFII
jgi:hypothetical protein